jgi:hypothetical protein
MSADGDDSGGSLILLNTPDWWQDITKAGGLFRYVVLVMVSAILAFWEAVIGTFADVMFWLFVYPLRVTWDVLGGATSPLWALLEWARGFQSIIESAAASAGLAGPLVALVGWLVPALLIIGILNVILGFAETYLPLSAIPILGRWFR